MKYRSTDPMLNKNGVLINKLKIETQEELDKKEAQITAIQTAILLITPMQGQFDIAHLKAIHKHLFNEIYSWAGEIRNIDICKGDTMFATSSRIVPELEKLFNQLKNEQFLKSTASEKIPARLAYYLGEINAIHPFREGNGRTQRLFIHQLAKTLGFYLNFEQVSEDEMIQASILSHKCDYSALEKIIKQGLTPIPK
ncbi:MULTISPECIES: Fic/DOC family protein [unclassified Avibacterium]|uniref:Fic/DOC family protein n=1 Tax=unclassified Avibacterium TaxID=2685287 RepID=UPI0020275B2C|nr:MULTISPECIES: Fic family protein [unclassified Avibacterium]MCW9718161.1 Fic family protein [Avibacterium sp. 21-599]URL01049.1 Fic family protein [Avibacterium sp. 20-126]URL05706.1 Fic family protein [Avibacterium sp. 21-595]